MRRRLLVACVTLLATGLGCNQGTEPPAVSTSNGGSTSASAPANNHAATPTSSAANSAAAAGKTTGETSDPAVKLSPALAPDAIVHHFLDALKSGDDRVAAHLLTDKARTETARHDLAVQPPGTPAAKYQVGRVEFVNPAKDGAYVHSVWIEPTETGAAERVEIVWVLRKQTDGWRIAGMATEISPNDPPLFLNFEDPADMLQKAEAAANQPAAQAGATQAGPTQPGTQAGPTRPATQQPAASTARRPANPVRNPDNRLRAPDSYQQRPPAESSPRYQPPTRR